MMSMLLMWGVDYDHVTTELRRERLRHDADPSSEEQSSQARSQPNRGQSRSTDSC